MLQEGSDEEGLSAPLSPEQMAGVKATLGRGGPPGPNITVHTDAGLIGAAADPTNAPGTAPSLSLGEAASTLAGVQASPTTVNDAIGGDSGSDEAEEAVPKQSDLELAALELLAHQLHQREQLLQVRVGGAGEGGPRGRASRRGRRAASPSPLHARSLLKHTASLPGWPTWY